MVQLRLHGDLALVTQGPRESGQIPSLASADGFTSLKERAGVKG